MLVLRVCVLFLLMQIVQSTRERKYNRNQTVLSEGARLMHSLKRSVKRFPNEVRPVLNWTDTMPVEFGLALLSIDNMEEVSTLESKMTASVWYRYTWRDCRLTWDPQEFGSLRKVSMPIDLMWRPDILLYNNLELGMQEDLTALAKVYHTGQVIWITMGKLSVNVVKKPATWWSESTWNAELKFGSWTYDGFAMDLQFYNQGEFIDGSNFKSVSYSLEGNEAEKHVKYYPCCAEPYIDLTFNLTLKHL